MKRIPLYQRGQVVSHVKVDDEDWLRFKDYRWRPRSPLGYASVTIDGRSEYMHRMILGLEPGSDLECDHINRDPLDNRRSNLRAVTHAENLRNQTKAGRTFAGQYEGVVGRNEKHQRVLNAVNEGLNITEVARKAQVHRLTVYRVLAAYA